MITIHAVKSLVVFPNGCRALLRLRPGIKTAIIEYYEPSAAYYKKIKEMKAQQAALANLKRFKYPEIELPTNSWKHCRNAAGVLINSIFRIKEQEANGIKNTVRAEA